MMTIKPKYAYIALLLMLPLSVAGQANLLEWRADSPSGRLHAEVKVELYNDVKQYSARATLYDESGETVWRHDSPMGSLERIFVTDEGTIVTFGGEESEGECRLVCNLIDAERVETNSVTLPVEVPDAFFCMPYGATLLTMVDSGICCMAFDSRANMLWKREIKCGAASLEDAGFSYDGGLLRFSFLEPCRRRLFSPRFRKVVYTVDEEGNVEKEVLK